jgi:HD superfamily phosphohydrolase
MAKKMSSPKVVADPVYGIIDIRPILPMVETEEFQTLGDKKQLGLTNLIFPSATHTRKAHSLGSYHATRELADRWIKLGFINEREGDALAGYALYHDIGHSAFSHITEPLCVLPKDVPKEVRNMSMNAAMSLAIIRRHKKEIEACGIDFTLLVALASHKNPLHAAVSDRNFGMEKLDYLERDGLATILSRPVGVDYLRHHIYFVKGSLAIDEKVVDNAIEAQNFYLKMYKNVYLRKTSAIAQRMLQKMTYRLIGAGEIAASELTTLTDSELLGIMRLSKDPIVRIMYPLFRKRDLYREAIVIRPKRFAAHEEKSEKGIVTFAANDKEMRHLTHDPALQVKNQQALASLEAKIAHAVGIPENFVLIAPIVSPERFEPQDIMIYRGPGKNPASLKARYPAHFKNMEEVALDYLTFRVCTTEEYRKKLSAPKNARRIFKLPFSARR